MNKRNVSMWLSLMACGLFVLAVFQIVDKSFLVGVVAFAGAACLQSVSVCLKKRDDLGRHSPY